MAPWYRALFPMPPDAVKRLKPTEVASILGLDQEYEPVLVPLADGEFIDLQSDAAAAMDAAPVGPGRLRRVVT